MVFRPSAYGGLSFSARTGLAALSAFFLFAAAPGIWQFSPLVWIGLVPLFAALDGCGRKRAFALGFVFGLVLNLLLVYWVVVALHRFGGLPYPAAVLVLVLLAAYMALYPALFALFTAIAPPSLLPVLAPAAWVGLDWLRSILLTGFPWMDLGYDLYRQPQMIQVSSLLGHHAVTFAIVTVNAAVYRFLRRRKAATASRGEAAAMAVAAAVMLAFIIGNVLAGNAIEKKIAAAPKKRIAIVQGNIPQDEKWDPAFQEKTLVKYLRLSLGTVGESPEIIVWPETALPFYPLESPMWRTVEEKLLVPAGVTLVTGAPHRENGASGPRYYNSAFVAGPTGIRGRYDKQHLVPFGEYVPLRRLLFFLSPVVDAIGDFTAGAGGDPLPCKGLRIGVLICFETIFPELAAERTRKGGDMLVDLTNDAWYGMTSAPWQDLAMAVFRAVECRRSMARAANTGFSAFIDPAGRMYRVSPLFAPYAAVHDLPVMKTKSFVVFGHGGRFGPACFLAALAVALAAGRKNRNDA